MPDTSTLCADALSLLKALPRGARGEDEARARFERFRRPYPDIAAELVATRSPVQDSVDYDVVIEDDEGTTGLSWRPNDGIPWTVKYAEHENASKVLGIDGMSIEVQDVLLLLKLSGGADAKLRERLLHFALIQHAIQQSPPVVCDLELRAAWDRFRRNRGLMTESTTRGWLHELGLSPQGIEKFLRRIVQTGKLRKRVTRDRVKPFFDAHSGEFDKVTMVEVEAPSAASAESLYCEARTHGLLAALEMAVARAQEGETPTARLETHRAFELPSPLATAPAGTRVGPTPNGSAFGITEVLRRRAAVFDSETRAAVETRLFEEWLDERRRAVDVRWYVR